jgi:hypothetical protein
MSDFVAARYDEGLTLEEIKREAVKRFRRNPAMVEAALTLLALWEYSNNAHVSRKRAARLVLGDAPTGVFDNLELYLSRVGDGRLLSVLDLNQEEILAVVNERRPVILGELRHVNCLEEIANALPGPDSTPRAHFKGEPESLFNIIQTYYGEESE